MRSRFGTLLVVVILALVGAGCESSATPDAVVVAGSIYTDFRIDLPCAEQPDRGPAELSGVLLTFRDGDGEPIGAARTGSVESENLDYGCRFLARYAVTLPRVPEYHVEFEAPAPKPGPVGGYFEGVQLLEPQTATYEQLEAARFHWAFEAEPAFVVP